MHEFTKTPVSQLTAADFAEDRAGAPPKNVCIHGNYKDSCPFCITFKKNKHVRNVLANAVHLPNKKN
jgi:hypothetical protein